jgi:aflatoxin B1 aldehyde reductase
MYCHGKTEEIIGETCKDSIYGLESSFFKIASKVNAFSGYNESLTPESVRNQSDASLSALQIPKIDIFYLHAPDIKVPIEDTLAAVQALYLEDRFEIFGLSNYAAWEVVYIHMYCSSRGWIVPTVYQGMYNAVTR